MVATSDERICVRVLEPLDQGAIDALADNLGAASELVVDFFHAPKVSDATLGYLLDRLSGRAPRLLLRGLNHHQEMVLHYFGTRDARSAQEQAWDAEYAEDGQLLETPAAAST